MKTPKKKLIISENCFPVVGIGASAGGLDAFKRLLKAIPESSGMAYVLVQHLDPTHESILQELLQKVTSIPVLEVTDEIIVVPDHVYIIPSNKMMIANDGVLELRPRPAKGENERNMPIDLFFRSLAEVHQSHSIGVVLSGTATDGTLGLKAIKDHGGITFAQDEESAAYSSMPNSAVQAGVVDFILPPGDIPRKIKEVAHIINGNGVENSGQKEEDTIYKQIIALLRVRKGTDFTYYKQTTIRRRILRRIAITKTMEPSAYLKYLRRDKQELDVLYMDLLIPVTEFFRNPEIFDKLYKKVIPNIIENKTFEDTIRVWVAGCSTGQEAYSIAIALYEVLVGRAPLSQFQKVQVFATDLSMPAIEKARSGMYSNSEVKGVSPDQLQRYFTKNNNGYQVNKSIRSCCVFAVHDFLKDPPFGKMDLISCRNVLIYLGGYLQKSALTTFHYALNPNGILWLGKSETTSGVPSHFRALDKKDKLFSRLEVPKRFIPTTGLRSEQSFNDLGGHGKIGNLRTDFQKTADDILLSRFTPAGVVINEAMDIVHFRGSTGRYLEPAPGKASLNLFRMAKHGLAFELRNILHKAKKENTAVVKENISVQLNGDETRNISIEAIPLPNIVEPHYLVLFHDRVLREGTLSAIGKKLPKKGDIGGKSKKNQKDLHIEQLEQELAQTREDMRSIIEEQEAANEELQSANEELMSGSEELQSLNEEMETSKEELHSTNEELMVVHQETIGLNEQLLAARDYAEGIVDTIHEPLLVLDRSLRIISANQAFYRTFEVNQKDTEGKLIFQLGNKQWDIPGLRTLLEDILPHKSTIENFEVARNYPNIGERNMLLNAREIRRDSEDEKLILLAIEDVTEKAMLRQKEKELLDRFENLLLQAPVAIMVLKGPEFLVELANEAYLGMVEKEKDFIGRPLFESLPELKLQGVKERLEGVMRNGVPYHGVELKILLLRKEKGEMGYFNLVYHPIHNEQNKVTGIMAVANEVTEKVRARQLVEESEYRYHNMIHSSPSLISVLKGENMTIEIANDAMLESWGKGKEIIGKSLFEVLPEAAEQGFEKLLLGVYRTGKSANAYEAPITRVRNGQAGIEYYTFMYQAQRNLQGEIEGVAIIANEVTPQAVLHQKLRESESHFRQMADLMPSKISNADIAGNVTYFNKNWLEFTGLDFKELKELGYHKIMHPEEVEEFGKRLEIALETGTNLEMEMRFLNKNGDYIWHLNIASPITDEKGDFQMWIGVSTDITEQISTRNRNQETYIMHSNVLEEQVLQRTAELRGSNDALQVSNSELKRLIKELEAFTYVASHDLQEPLRKIQTFIGRISDGESDGLTDKGKGYFQRVYAVSEQMRGLIKDLLDFSRLGSAERKFVETNLGAITEEVIREFEGLIDEKKATINCEEMDTVKVIPYQFRQLMYNLIANALKFSKPDNPPHITIKSKIAKGNKLEIKDLLPDKRYCQITVEDNGIGFKPEYGDQIFEVFKRLHGKEVYLGSGIGLAIVKRIIENHNGTITVEGELDRGARFDIYIPVF
ncbi:chemotaxis protein CheB [Arenibacter arenosicollis]|nr:chemotaxis protein CheB [Arenibacter arenosicollis]